jgi:hypothetical protein
VRDRIGKSRRIASTSSAVMFSVIARITSIDPFLGQLTSAG